MENEELVITRVFDAPVEKVWKAWTTPELAAEWWGPKDFTAPSIDIDFREGGSYLFDMKAPDGKDYWSTGIYKEIVPMKKIVATDNFADEKGNVVPASYYNMGDDFPMDLKLEILFKDLDGKTELTLRYPTFPQGKVRKDATQGWNESLDKMAEILK